MQENQKHCSRNCKFLSLQDHQRCKQLFFNHLQTIGTINHSFLTFTRPIDDQIFLFKTIKYRCPLMASTWTAPQQKYTNNHAYRTIKYYFFLITRPFINTFTQFFEKYCYKHTKWHPGQLLIIGKPQILI